MTTTAVAERPVRSRAMVLATVLVLIGLPALLVLSEAVWHHIRNRHNGSIVSSGETREYVLHVPKNYDRARPTPLVISLHGGALWGAAQMVISQWNGVAEREGVIVVYPSGSRGDGPRHWETNDEPSLMREVRFIADLVDTLSAGYHIDSRRIYADGLSNGGGMALVLSCRLSDRIAAIGMVAAAHFLPWDWCTERRAVPMIAFHGTADPATPYRGGRTWVAPVRFPSIPIFTANLARRNRCKTGPVDSVVAADVTRSAYSRCADGADVLLYTVREGGHTWPGGGPQPEWMVGSISHGVDATREMWEFFRAHPLPRQRE